MVRYYPAYIWNDVSFLVYLVPRYLWMLNNMSLVTISLLKNNYKPLKSTIDKCVSFGNLVEDQYLYHRKDFIPS